MTSPVAVHPIFSKCREYTFDPYWKDIFARCSYNRFPRGIRYDGRKNTLYVRLPGGIGGKREFFSLPKEAVDVFTTMMSVFREMGLCSQMDLEVKRDEMEKIREQRRVNLDCRWKDLKPRYLKDRMIVRYVLHLKETYDLTQKETKKLLNTIQLGFQLKQLSSDHVKYQNGMILDINGLEVEDKKFHVTREIRKCNKTDKPNTTHRLQQAFENYLKESKKQKLKI